ncbi:MAG: hypothetical protein R6U84_04835 [Candidatus Cloacimonadales bacterium]
MNKIMIILLFVLILISCDDITSPIIPNVPYNLQLNVLDSAHLDLSWQINSSAIGDTLRFTIAKKSGEQNWNENHAMVLDIENFVDEVNTADSLVYAYKVKATNLSEDITYSFSQPKAYFSAATDPTDLQLEQISQNNLLIQWQDKAVGEEGYIIEKQVDGGNWVSPYARIESNKESYIDQVDAFETINYKVYAYFGNDKSTTLSESIQTTLGSPDNLSLSKPDDNKVRLTWQDNSNGEEGFFIDRKLGELEWETEIARVDSNVTEYIDDVDFPAATLQYRVYGFSGAAYSGYSNPEEINIRLNLIGEYQTAGAAKAVIVEDLVAYIADNYNGLEIVNCFTPNSPQQITNISIPDRTLAASLEGDFVYVTSNSGAAPGLISKIDLNDMQAPFLTGSATISGIPNGIATLGDHAYIASGDAGLVTAYISAMNPAIVTNTATGGFARKVTISGHYAFVTNGLDGFSILNVLNPAAPTLLSTHPASGLANNIAVQNGLACLTNGENGADFFDVSNPHSAVFLHNYQNDGFIYDAEIVGNYAYLVDKDRGILLLDISDINSPYQMGIYRMDTEPVSVYNYGSYLFITDNEGLKIVQVRS